jgi:hypothetical protein
MSKVNVTEGWTAVGYKEKRNEARSKGADNVQNLNT